MVRPLDQELRTTLKSQYHAACDAQIRAERVPNRPGAHNRNVFVAGSNERCHGLRAVRLIQPSENYPSRASPVVLEWRSLGRV